MTSFQGMELTYLCAKESPVHDSGALLTMLSGVRSVAELGLIGRPLLSYIPELPLSLN